MKKPKNTHIVFRKGLEWNEPVRAFVRKVDADKFATRCKSGTAGIEHDYLDSMSDFVVETLPLTYPEK